MSDPVNLNISNSRY